MKEFYYIYSHDRKEFYRGKKNYPWTDSPLFAMAFESKPDLRNEDKFKGLFVEIKTLYV